MMVVERAYTAHLPSEEATPQRRRRHFLLSTRTPSPGNPPTGRTARGDRRTAPTRRYSPFRTPDGIANTDEATFCPELTEALTGHFAAAKAQGAVELDRTAVREDLRSSTIGWKPTTRPLPQRTAGAGGIGWWAGSGGWNTGLERA
jgi:hypothetical protein